MHPTKWRSPDPEYQPLNVHKVTGRDMETPVTSTELARPAHHNPCKHLEDSQDQTCVT